MTALLILLQAAVNMEQNLTFKSAIDSRALSCDNGTDSCYGSGQNLTSPSRHCPVSDETVRQWDRQLPWEQAEFDCTVKTLSCV